MGKLAGVECAACRRKGHRCQAQLRMDGEALCVRCADGLPCCWETAAALKTPARLAEIPDACEVPPPSAEDREALAQSVRQERMARKDPATRRQALEDAKTMGAEALAEKYHVKIAVANGWKSQAFGRRVHTGGRPRQYMPAEHAEQITRMSVLATSKRFGVCQGTAQRWKREARAMLPVAQTIGGERVVMAARAVMGAEMLGARS